MSFPAKNSYAYIQHSSINCNKLMQKNKSPIWSKKKNKRKIYDNYNKRTKNPNKFYIKEDKKRYNYIPISVIDYGT